MGFKKIMAGLVAGALAVTSFAGVMPSSVPEIGESVGVSAAEIVDSGKCGDNVKWELDSEGTLTISGSGKMMDYSYNSPFEYCNIKKSLYQSVLQV